MTKTETHDVSETGSTPGWPAFRRRLVMGIAISAAVIALLGTSMRLVTSYIELPGALDAILNGLRSLTYPNAEGNLWSWYSALMIAVLGISFAVLGITLERTGSKGRVYFVLAGVSLLLSLDETAQIHENFIRVSRALGISSSLTYDWLLIGIPVAIAAGFALVWITRRIDRKLRRWLIVGGAVYLFGAAVLEGLTGVLSNTRDLSSDVGANVAYQIVMTIEELFEFAGVLIAIAAVLAMFRIVRSGESLVLSVVPSS